MPLERPTLLEALVRAILRWCGHFQRPPLLPEQLWAAASVIHDGRSEDGSDFFRGGWTGCGAACLRDALRDPDSRCAHPRVPASAQGGGENMYLQRFAWRFPNICISPGALHP